MAANQLKCIWQQVDVNVYKIIKSCKYMSIFHLPVWHRVKTQYDEVSIKSAHCCLCIRMLRIISCTESKPSLSYGLSKRKTDRKLLRFKMLLLISSAQQNYPENRWQSFMRVHKFKIFIISFWNVLWCINYWVFCLCKLI